MTFLEGDGPSGMLPAIPANFGFVNELTRSNVDAFASTAQNCDDIWRRSAHTAADGCTTWTNEKHSLYLNHLEVSFVNQLQQSMLAQSSEHYDTDISISQKQPPIVFHASEKLTIQRNRCCQTSNDERDESFSHSYTDPQNLLMGPWINNHRKIRIQCHSSLADMQELQKLHCTKKDTDGKVRVSCELEMLSEHFSASNVYKGCSFDLLKEGGGQNFVNEDKSYISNKYRAKRLKTFLADSSDYDQTETPKKFPRTDNSDV